MTEIKKTNYLFIINDAPYGNERPHNALRLALNLVKREDASVRVFLMGDGVNCAIAHQKTPEGYYNVERMLKSLAKRGEAAARVRSGYFNRNGELPLNTHGGLLSYGHCGVGGAMAHLVETHLQMTERAGARQVGDASIALLHGDGGVLSSHVSMFLERVR